MASGTGSNFKEIVEYGLPVSLLMCNKAEAGAIRYAERFGVPHRFALDSYHNSFLKTVAGTESEPDLIVLAGYDRILPKSVVDLYPNKIVNIHPSLLPAYSGTMKAVEEAYEAKETRYGITIHFVDESVDAGPVITQRAFTINPESVSIKELKSMVHALEHEIYPKIIKRLIK